MQFTQVLVFLFCLLLPAGWAKHWITPQSLVGGVLVDYLMPDIWIQDLIAVIFTAQILLTRNWKFAPLKLKYLISPGDSGVNFTTVISGLLVLISIILSPIPLISAINFIRFLLAMAVGWVIYKNKNLHRFAAAGLAGAVIWTSFLAVGQFVNQGTFIGWQFFGEPIFTSGTGGIKKIFLFGQELFAPMATFPHANVMGAFGLLYFLISGGDKPRSYKLLKISKYLSLLLILLSFSLPVWLITFYFLIRKFKPAYTALFFSMVMVLGIIGLRVVGYGFPARNAVLAWRAWPITSIHRRLNLSKHALTLIKNNPFFGVGWGGFVRKLPPATFLQPVHNVYLLILAELGIVGTSGLVLVVDRYLKNLDLKKYLLLFTRPQRLACLAGVAVYLLLFLVDHYFWTTTQGIYMLWVMISLF